jgi:hypothetical protein
VLAQADHPLRAFGVEAEEVGRRVDSVVACAPDEPLMKVMFGCVLA